MPIAATSERLRTHNETLPRCKNGQLRLLQVGVEAVVALKSAALGYALESNWAYIHLTSAQIEPQLRIHSRAMRTLSFC